ncbi:MAG: acylneuraminate cytidylyltransferase family protein [Propionibacteriaceae bacterium]|nr:acylneuraminate cytidylyltransferase family protein [Propionibacteriaceae bacterium]
MNIVAIIPARGGSKGIPRKNLKPIAGRPLIEWTIGQALAVPGLRVIVSTEDAEIAATSAAAGAEVIHRPAELAQDTTATEPVVEHAIAELSARGERPDAVMLLQATSPVRLPGTLDRAIGEFASSGADSTVGVVTQAPFLWRWRFPARADYDYTRRPRRQDLSASEFRYRETGSVYLTKTGIYEREHNRLGGRIGLFVMADIEGSDIDTLADWDLAEARLRSLYDT